MDTSGIHRFLNVPGLRGLNADEQDKVASFLKSPGKDEFFFLLQMLGQTPVRVRTMVVEEFIRRFGLEAQADAIRKALPPMGSWRPLDAATTELAGSMGAEHLRFWEKMRYVLEALPEPKGCGDERGEANEGEVARPNRGWSFATCKFCWRRVLHNPGVIRKTANLCFKHNLPAMHPVYRRHRRLEQQLAHEQRPIAQRIMALVSAYRSEKESQDLLYSQLTTPDGCLPRLAKHLDGTGHDGTPESLLWAFHGPASDIKDSLYMEALREYIRYTLDAANILAQGRSMPLFSIDELSRAEAWLTLLQQNAGRK